MTRPGVIFFLSPSYSLFSQTIPLPPFFYSWDKFNLFVLCVTAMKLVLFVVWIAKTLRDVVNSLPLIVWPIASSHRSQRAWSIAWPLSLSARLSVIVWNVCVLPFTRLQTLRLPAPDSSYAWVMATVGKFLVVTWRGNITKVAKGLQILVNII